MSFDSTSVDTITVDSYGTLVDPDAVETALEAHVDAVRPISALWRSRSIMYTMVSNFVDEYQTFYEMNRDALRFALESRGIELSSETVEEVLSAYHDLDPFDDVRDGLETLTDAGYDVYVLSNGNPAMLESMVESAQIGHVISDTISADEIRTFKPDADIYRHAADRTGTALESMAHVAGPTFDVRGAMHAGMQGVWINRDDGPWDPSATEPDLIVETFFDLTDELAP
ncbi:haloacid dehalogenase type II [Natronorubrum sp. FCH18a]|uniref:haloacid dehalogenase type II n=1 Tax=Natronorubrum sp. FCH18a TaxID=3447018 RepID=UPI003F518AAE